MCQTFWHSLIANETKNVSRVTLKMCINNHGYALKGSILRVFLYPHRRIEIKLTFEKNIMTFGPA